MILGCVVQLRRGRFRRPQTNHLQTTAELHEPRLPLPKSTNSLADARDYGVSSLQIGTKHLANTRTIVLSFTWLMNIFEKYPNSKFLKKLPDDSDLFPLRKRVVELFRSLDGLEDRHFDQQLDQDPYARLWEMMLATILTAHGYSPRSAEHGPDFVVEHEGRRVFIEAICPGPGDEASPNSVPPPVYGAGIAQDVPVDKIALRLCHALAEKKRRYTEYLAQRIQLVQNRRRLRVVAACDHESNAWIRESICSLQQR